MKLFTILLLYGGYVFALSLLIVTLFFGWSRAIRAILVFFAGLGIAFQYGCNRLVDGIGKATGGADIPTNIFPDHKALMTTICVLLLLALFVPNWRNRNPNK